MNEKQQIEIGRRELTISNVEKVFYPEDGFTKGEVIRFYSDIADAILPHLRDRPLTLKRYPDGITAEHFYEKNAPKHTPPWVKRFAVPRSEGGPDINYVLCNDRATLIWSSAATSPARAASTRCLSACMKPGVSFSSLK